MTETPQQFTATQIARALGKSRQAARRLLCGVATSGTVISGGNPADAWGIAALPALLREALTARAEQLGYSSVEDLFTSRPETWQPPLAVSKISQRCIDDAAKLQRALRRALVLQNNLSVSRVERERIGLEDYAREFGSVISDRYLRELIKRTMDRDGGAENWKRLEIYLPDKPEPKKAPAIASQRIAPELCGVYEFISSIKNSTPALEESVWTLAFAGYKNLKASGLPARKAARQVRAMLFSSAQFLAPSREALLKAFNRRLQKFDASEGDVRAVLDRRVDNGDTIELPISDLDILRASAAFANGGRVDAAWRESYPDLSESTRNRWPFSMEAPRKLHELLVREKVDALTARHMRGKITVRRMIGGVQRSWEGVPSMLEWVADDVTSNIQVFRKMGDGTKELFMPQIVAVMDSASRKIVGVAISSDKGPTAELVCLAVLDGFKTHGVPSSLGLENGFVFGKALNVNGKEDEEGRTVVAGLAQYGCAIRHFDKMSPTSKAELEKAFDLIQQRMEEYPGYAGRLQMLDAPEEFKREERYIKSGKMDASEVRLEFHEFCTALIEKIISEYNSKPQGGHLKGLSPNEAHEMLKDKNNLPISFTPELEWLLTNARYRVRVEVGGVRFTHYGESVRVRGGKLTSLIGSELWALVDRADASLVTFMDINFSNPFTIEACQKPSACERLIAAGSGVLGRERAKVREHEKAVNTEYNRLILQQGNPRVKILQAIRGESRSEQNRRGVRPAEISNRLANSASAMNEQRSEIKKKKNSEAARSRNLRSKAARAGVPTSLINDGDDDSRAALDLRMEAAREHAHEQAAEAEKGKQS